MKPRTWSLALAAFCMLAEPLRAQLAIRIDLSDEWRFQEGDDPAWVRPDFDDSAWARAKLARRTDQGFLNAATSPGWYRKRLDLPPEAGDGRSKSRSAPL